VTDLDDTSGCPVAGRCESCGAGPESDLAVCTVSTRVSVLCLTLCAGCGDLSVPVRLSGWIETFERVCAHVEHLGITLDEMAQLLEQEQEP
jgi:hypothetical protein